VHLGMKQDITDAKKPVRRTRYLADFDMMTGLANRRSSRRNCMPSAKIRPMATALDWHCPGDLDDSRWSTTLTIQPGGRLLPGDAESLRKVCGGCRSDRPARRVRIPPSFPRGDARHATSSSPTISFTMHA